MKRLDLINLVLLWIIALSGPASGAVKCAKVGGSGSLCSNWANACGLQTAIDAATLAEIPASTPDAVAG